jgi:hypothetical protein
MVSNDTTRHPVALTRKWTVPISYEKYEKQRRLSWKSFIESLESEPAVLDISLYK